MKKPPFERVIFVCCNEREPGEAACASRGSKELQKKLKEYTKDKGLRARIRVSRAMCFGLCEIGPNICIQPDNVWYSGVTEADLPEIIRRHIDPGFTGEGLPGR